MALWIFLFELGWITSLMTSSCLKIGQILKSSYLRQFLSYSIETKTEMQRWSWDIILLWLTSGVTSGLTLNFDIKMAAILKMPKYYMQLQFDIRYEKIVPNYARKSIFRGHDVIHDVTGWPQSRPSLFLYKWNMNIFRDNWKTNKGIIIKLGVHMYPWILASTQSPDCPFNLVLLCWLSISNCGIFKSSMCTQCHLDILYWSWLYPIDEFLDDTWQIWYWAE